MTTAPSDTQENHNSEMDPEFTAMQIKETYFRPEKRQTVQFSICINIHWSDGSKRAIHGHTHGHMNSMCFDAGF